MTDRIDTDAIRAELPDQRIVRSNDEQAVWLLCDEVDRLRAARELSEDERALAALPAPVPEGVPQEGVVVLNGQRYTLKIASMPAIWDEAIRGYLPAHPIPVALVALSDTPHEEGAPAMIANPGSREARAEGCNCPVLDNAHGRGAWGSEGDDAVFVQRQDCPLHGWTQEEETR